MWFILFNNSKKKKFEVDRYNTHTHTHYSTIKYVAWVTHPIP